MKNYASVTASMLLFIDHWNVYKCYNYAAAELYFPVIAFSYVSGSCATRNRVEEKVGFVKCCVEK